MNNHYIKEELPQEISDIIWSVLRNNNISNIFDYNLWIAGGFPRIVQYIKLNNLNAEKVINNYFCRTSGDIDIFSSCAIDISNFLKSKSSKRKFYSSPFALNTYPDPVSNVRIQIVNQFLYNSFEECLDSFDFTNCKYLIYKEKEKLYFLKNIKSDYFSRKNLINIDKCSSPLLAQRIIKYFNKYNFESLSNTKETKNSIKEYLFKVASNSWDYKFEKMGNLNEIAEAYIKVLHEKIKLSNISLSVLVGKFSHHKYSNFQNDYGFYLKPLEKTDWASYEIRKNNLQKR